MSDHANNVKRVVSDIWDPASKVKESDVDLLLHHLRTSFSDEKSLLSALKLDQDDIAAKLERLHHAKEQAIDHNIEPE